MGTPISQVEFTSKPGLHHELYLRSSRCQVAERALWEDIASAEIAGAMSECRRGESTSQNGLEGEEMRQRMQIVFAGCCAALWMIVRPSRGMLEVGEQNGAEKEARVVRGNLRSRGMKFFQKKPGKDSGMHIRRENEPCHDKAIPSERSGGAVSTRMGPRGRNRLLRLALAGDDLRPRDEEL